MTDINTNILQYPVDGNKHIGYFACADDGAGTRPGVMIIHEWWGLDDYIRGRANQLAELGYAALAIDMYGNGATADNPGEASTLMNSVLEDMDTGTQRLKAAYENLLTQPQVDAERTAAIGYCFGGAMVLHMARIGMPLRAVSSFHGALGSFHTPEPDSIKAKILVCHGGADAMVSEDDLNAFRAEMDSARAEYEVAVYPQAMHGFTNPAATQRGGKYSLPLAYDEVSDQQSWRAMQDLFVEVFG